MRYFALVVTRCLEGRNDTTNCFLIPRKVYCISCQKVKTNSINAIKTSINTVEITQSFRNSLLMWGGIIDALMVILGFFTIKSR